MIDGMFMRKSQGNLRWVDNGKFNGMGRLTKVSTGSFTENLMLSLNENFDQNCNFKTELPT